MALEILLRRSIEGVGNVGEIVRVKNGYARNFLIPRGYASLVTPDALRRIQKDRKAVHPTQTPLHRFTDFAGSDTMNSSYGSII